MRLVEFGRRPLRAADRHGESKCVSNGIFVSRLVVGRLQVPPLSTLFMAVPSARVCLCACVCVQVRDSCYSACLRVRGASWPASLALVLGEYRGVREGGGGVTFSPQPPPRSICWAGRRVSSPRVSLLAPGSGADPRSVCGRWRPGQLSRRCSSGRSRPRDNL